MIKAVILVGGLGTRLKPLTLNTPKSMVPILNAPFLEHVLLRLRAYNIRNIVLALSHLAPSVSNYFGDGDNIGVELEYVVESSPLGTAGAVRNAAGHIEDTCIVMNGDIYTDLDIGAMLEFHRRYQSKVTIALTEVENPSAYGLVETRENERIHRFLEKPSPEQITTNRINSGTYIIEPGVLELIPPQQVYSFEKGLFPQLLANDEAVYAYADRSYWIDIGTPHKYHQLNRDLLRGKGKQYGFSVGNEIVIGPRCTIHPTDHYRPGRHRSRLRDRRKNLDY
jgi:mannose-1-phosphate guanylyltransferase